MYTPSVVPIDPAAIPSYLAQETLALAQAFNRVTFTPAGTGAKTQTLQTKLRQFVTVLDKAGADNTGSTDSTSAFNNLTTDLRAAISATDYPYVSFKVVIPPGIYSVSSWDLTSILGRNVEIDMRGAVLVARTAGKHVIDGIGSRWLRFTGGVVYSASGVVAKSGLQLGPKGTETCGNCETRGLTIMGHFASAPFMNLGAETTKHRGSDFIQRNTDAAAFAMICDGLSTYLPTSDYATITRGAGTAVSFTANQYYGCQIRNEGGGSAGYLGKTQGWEFDKSTYWLSYNDSGVVVYGTGTYRTDKLAIRGSFETNTIDTPTAGNTGIKYAVTFSNDSTNTAISGFTFESSNMQAQTAAFRVTGGGTCRLSDADIRMHSIDQAAAVMFGAGSLSIDGLLMTQSAAKTNLGALSAFNGVIDVDDYAALVSVPAAGGFTAYSRADNIVRQGGTQEFTSAPVTFTPTITFATPGDLSTAYTVQSGWVFKLGKLRFFHLAISFTPTHTTASGEFRIAGLPDSSDSSTNRESAIGVTNINSAWTWPASTTQVMGRLPANSTNLRLYGHGTGVASTVFTTAHVTSGTAKALILSGFYVAA